MSSARIDVDGWIASEPNWRYRVGEGWEGRFLGEGGWGSVGTWRYAGPPDTAPAVKEVVVKMIPVGDPDDSEGALNGSTVYDEANIGKTLNIPAQDISFTSMEEIGLVIDLRILMTTSLRYLWSTAVRRLRTIRSR